jgi:hypothetical protein
MKTTHEPLYLDEQNLVLIEMINTHAYKIYLNYYFVRKVLCTAMTRNFEVMLGQTLNYIV